MSDQAVYTALGWIVVISAGGWAYYYYQTANSNRRAFRGPSSRAPSSVSESNTVRLSRARRREDKRDTSDVPSSDGGSANGRVKKPKPAKSSGSRFEVLETNEPEEEGDDVEFAEALQKSRKGTTFVSSSRQDSRQKTVKQADVNKRSDPSANSSTTGAEADDDLSPVISPALNATKGGELPNGVDVSDMLEPGRPAPTILSIKPAQKPEREKPKPQPKQEDVQETKKQRQNRKKKEEKQAAQQDLEQQRKKMEEAQRRTARVARGEPAKNGVMSSSASPSNPWNGVKHAGAVRTPISTGPLLDTFTSDNVSTGSSNVPHSAASNSTGDVHWEAGLPDEDEQMRRIMEQDESAWHTVPVGGKRGKKKQVEKPGADTTETEYSETDTKGSLAVQRPQDGKSIIRQDLSTPVSKLTW